MYIQMSSKSEQLNIRISPSLKSDLQKTADKLGISASDLIRTSLEQAITQDRSELQEKVKTLEKKLDHRWDQMQRKLIMASATISSIDTGHPLDHCINLVMKNANTELDFTNSTRTDLEREALDIHLKMAEELGASENARMMISLITITYIAMVYSEDIFSPTPFSLEVMKRVRSALDKSD